MQHIDLDLQLSQFYNVNKKYTKGKLKDKVFDV